MSKNKFHVRTDDGTGWPRIGTDSFKKACDRVLERGEKQPKTVHRNGAQVVTIKRKVRVQAS
jgi:hypothetical protein